MVSGDEAEGSREDERWERAGVKVCVRQTWRGLLYAMPHKFSFFTLFFKIYFWRALVCWPTLGLCLPFFYFLRDVWIRIQSAAVASGRATNLATHLTHLYMIYIPLHMDSFLIPWSSLQRVRLPWLRIQRQNHLYSLLFSLAYLEALKE